MKVFIDTEYQNEKSSNEMRCLQNIGNVDS